MAIPFAAVIPVIGQVIDKIFPDKNAANEHKLKLLEMTQAGEFKEIETQLQRDLEQIELNKVEAASQSFWKSGWRPAVGWVCAGGLGYQFVVRPLLQYAIEIIAFVNEVDMTAFPAAPALNIETLMTLLFGMLGLGVYRTYEKVREKA